MKNNRGWFSEVKAMRARLVVLAWMGIGVSAMAAAGQEQQAAPPAKPAAQIVTSDIVNIDVTGASIADVLSAFSRQTGRSVVIGAGVTNLVTIRLNNTPWQEALNVILQPYGYGYKQVGETIVVNDLKDIASMEQEEALVTEVFTLKYVDATELLDIIQKQLSTNRGAATVLYSQHESGWDFGPKQTGGSVAAQSGAGAGEKRIRATDAAKKKSKTLIIKDTHTVIESIRRIIASVDTMPLQVLIEARFIEVNSTFLRDLGLEWGTGAGGATSIGPQTQNRSQGGNVFGLGAQMTGGGVTPAAFSAASGTTLNDHAPFNAGLALRFQQLTGTQFELIMHMLQEDNSLNILSSPRVLTMNNQEATIKVGTKFPIIQSDVSGTTGGSTVSTSLQYYEDIGIQLNVIPQVCGDKNISMIVHPAVTDQIGTESGVVVSGSSMPQTRYPILSTREAETQIILQSGATVVIGGLLKKRDANTQLKTPFLGNIPVLGWLFRRDTRDNEKLDLLIFLTATIMPTGAEMEIADEQIAKARQETRRMTEAAATARVEADRAIAGERAARVDAERRAKKETEARIEADHRADAAQEAEQKTAREAERARIQAAEKSQADSEAKAKEEARLEAARKAEVERLANEKRVAAEAKKAEQARLAAEEKARAEAAESTAAAEKARIASEKKAQAEAEAKLAAQVRADREAEEARLEAAKKAEAERLANEKRLAAESKKAEQARLAAEEKARTEAAEIAAAAEKAKARAAREAEKARIAAEKKAHAEAEAKLAAQARADREAEEARLEAARQAEAERLANEKRLAAEARKAEKARLAAEEKAREEAAEAAAAAEKAKARAASEAKKIENARLAAEEEAGEEAAEFAAAAEEAKNRSASLR